MSAVPALLITALAAAGCGSNSGNGSGATGTTSPSGGSTSAGQAATGTPITIGYINEENDPAASYPDIHTGADAAVSYINSHGGLGGRPLKLDVCVTQLASGGARCAQQMVADKVPVVTGGINLTSSQIWPVLKQAGIPFFGTFPVFSVDSTSDGNHFYFGGGNQATFPGAVKLMAQGAKTVDVLNADVSTDEIKKLTQSVIEGAGAKVNYVPVPQGQADYSSALLQIEQDKPDAVFVVLPTPDCVKVMQEAPSVGLTTQMYYLSGCAGNQTFSVVGSPLVGARFVLDTNSFTDTTNPDVAVFTQAMASVGKTSDIDGFTADGFSSVMNVYGLMKQAGDATATSASILKVALDGTTQHGFMSPDFNCAQPPIPTATAVCGDGGRVVELQSDGKTLKDVGGDWLTGS